MNIIMKMINAIIDRTAGRMKRMSTTKAIQGVFALASIVFVGFSISSYYGISFPRAEGSHGTSIIGIQMADGNLCPGVTWGIAQFTSVSGRASGWATDNNQFDPDCARINISSFSSWDKDFRVGIRMSDRDGIGCGEELYSTPRFTPWASEGGGKSGWATDANQFDPNCAEVIVETREFPNDTFLISDARIGIQLNDNACTSQFGVTMFTPWAKNGGGWSGWATDANQFDPDCAQLILEAKTIPVGEVKVKVVKTGVSAAPLPPATWLIRDANGALIAEQNVPTKNESTTYRSVLYGTYTIEAPVTLSVPGYVYTLTNISPSRTQSLGGSSASCPAGQYSPHGACNGSGACVAVDGCGVNNCGECIEPVRPLFINFFNRTRDILSDAVTIGLFINHAEAVISAENISGEGEDPSHNECVSGFCSTFPGSGTDECTEHADCPGYSPPQFIQPAPIVPKSIEFTLSYEAKSAASQTVFYVLRATTTGSGLGTITAPDNELFNPPALVCGAEGDKCVAKYSSGKVVQLTANPSPGSVFDTWGGDPDCLDGVVTMNTNKSCVAQFSLVVVVDPPDRRPDGFHETAVGGSFCTISGWTADPDNRDKDLRVRIYADGAWIKDEIAGKYRGDLKDAGVCSDGFCAFQTDSLAPYLTPNVDHSMLVRAVNVNAAGNETGTEFDLWWSPRTINCSGGDSTGPTVGTVSVSSNRATRWELSGPTPQSQRTLSSSKIYRSQAPGSYQLVPENISGCTYAPLSSKRLDAGRTIRFDIVYNCPSPSAPTFSVIPDSRSVRVGDIACFDALYDSDGAGSSVAQNVSRTGSTWSVANQSVASYVGQSATCSDGIAFRGESPGVTSVRASYNPEGTATINVTEGSPPSFTISLIADPDSGNAPLATEFTASVGGTETGTINYYLWWDCAYVGASVAGGTAQCGNISEPPLGECRQDAIGFRCNAISEDSKSAQHEYSSAGTYRATTVIERGNSSAGDDETIFVSGSESHFECVANACSIVSGAGPDRCDADVDCGDSPSGPGGPGGGGPIHSVCDAVWGACVNEFGPGANQCGSDVACGDFPRDTHFECQNDACVIVGGRGINECSEVGVGCSSLTDFHLECINNACTLVSGTGSDQCSADVDCGGESPACTFNAAPSVIKQGEVSVLRWECRSGLNSYIIRDDKGNLIRSGSGNGSEAVTPKETTTYTITFNRGTPQEASMSITIRVLKLGETTPN